MTSFALPYSRLVRYLGSMMSMRRWYAMVCARRPAGVLAALFVVALSTNVPGAPKWKTHETPHFTLVGEVSDGQLRDIGFRLELFREVLGRRLRAGPAWSSTPTVVIVFGSHAALEPYMPVHNGKRVQIGGMFLAGRDVHYVLMAGDFKPGEYQVIFHEYTHSVVNDTITAPPVWLNEGLAEYYSTFSVSSGGKRATTGTPPARHVELLLRRSLLPLQELFALTHDSPVYNGEAGRSAFYAQSWALVHYFVTANPARWNQYLGYHEAVSRGRGRDAAFREAFGCEPATVERELQEYIRRNRFAFTEWTSDGRNDGSVPPMPAPLPDSDVQAELAELLVRLDRPDEARNRLQPYLEADKSSASVLRALGSIEMYEARWNEAVSLMQRATAAAPDDARAHYGVGRAWYERLTETGISSDAAARRAAMDAFTRALQLRPDIPDAVAKLDYLESFEEGRLASARDRLTRAVELAPSREEYRLMLGQILIRRNEIVNAWTILEPLATMGSSDAVRTEASRLLANARRLP